MYLKDVRTGDTCVVEKLNLPFELERRLEALGMTTGTPVSVLNRKGKGIMIIKLQGDAVRPGIQHHAQHRSGGGEGRWQMRRAGDDDRLYRQPKLRQDDAVQRLHRREPEGGQLAGRHGREGRGADDIPGHGHPPRGPAGHLLADELHDGGDGLAQLHPLATRWTS